MSDLTDELTRLAELRDRGVLTPAEFGQQKARLLAALSDDAPKVQPTIPTTPQFAPPSSYAAAPARAGNASLFVIGGLALVVALLAILWLTGALRSLGLNPPGSDSSSSMAFNPMSLSNGSTVAPASPLVPPIAPPAPPAPVPSYSPSYAPSTGANPLVGSWQGSIANKDECPTRLIFTSTYLMFFARENGVPRTQQVNVIYNVQAPTSVVVTPQNGTGHPGTAVITGDQMALDGCGFRRG